MRTLKLREKSEENGKKRKRTGKNGRVREKTDQLREKTEEYGKNWQFYGKNRQFYGKNSIYPRTVPRSDVEAELAQCSEERVPSVIKSTRLQQPRAERHQAVLVMPSPM